MQAKARHWVNYNGVWHGKDEVFDIEPADAAEMKHFADLTETEPKPETVEPAPEPVKRGRRRKTEE